MGVQFRWYSGDNDVVPSHPGPPPRKQRLGYRLVLVSAFVLAVVGGVYWQSQRGLRAVRADLQRLVDREVMALQSGQREDFIELLDARYGPWLRYHQENFEREAAWYAARPGIRAHVEEVRLGPDLAIARIRLRDERGAQTEPVEWYFRRIRGQWRHAPPVPEVWGATAEVETSHLSLAAQGTDREAAARLAPELEALWLELARVYFAGQAPHAGAPAGAGAGPGRVAMRIVPYGISSHEAGAIPSPHLAMELWSPDQRYAHLARDARLATVRSLLQQVLGHRQSRSADRWLLESLALWHAGAWQPEWRASVQSSLADGTFSELFSAQGLGPRPDVLAWNLHALPASQERVLPLAYTLGEFLGHTYPPDRLGALLRAVRACGSSWAAVESVLGLDRQGLETAWASHLQQHYAAY